MWNTILAIIILVSMIKLLQLYKAYTTIISDPKFKEYKTPKNLVIINLLNICFSAIIGYSFKILLN